MTHKTLDILQNDRVWPRMVQVNANSVHHSVFIYSTPQRTPEPVKTKKKRMFSKETFDFMKKKIKPEPMEYDILSWVRYSNVGKSDMSFELRKKPIFDKAL